MADPLTVRRRWLFDFAHWAPSEAEWNSALSLVSPEEQKRILRFKRPTVHGILVGKDNLNAKSSLAGLLMLRKAAQAVLTPGEQPSFARTKEGKPYLVNHPTGLLNFNLNVSHDGEFVAFGCEPTLLIGVDIMSNTRAQTESTDEFFGMMENCFTPNEWKVIKAAPSDSKKMEMFYTFWCLKESYIKAVGIGLGFELQRAEFTLDNTDDPKNATVMIDSVVKSDWMFEVHKLKGHTVAVAYASISESIESFRATVKRAGELVGVLPTADLCPRIEFTELRIQDLTA